MLNFKVKGRPADIYIFSVAIFLAGFVLLYFFGSLFLSVNFQSVHAASDVEVNVESASLLSVADACTIPTLDITTPFNYCDIVATVISNNSAGYNLYLSMTEEVGTSNDNTCLRYSSKATTPCSSISSNDKFASLPASTNISSFAAGAWGVSYNTEFTTYNNIPSYTSTQLLVKSTSTTSPNDTTTVRFGAKYNIANQTLGDYQNTVLFTAVSNPPAMTATAATMQNFDTSLCSMMESYDAITGQILANSPINLEATTLTGTNTVYLKDIRNSQLYRVRKMQDGRCWMIDNLKIYNTTLTSTDSDMATGSFILPNTLNTSASTNNTSARIDNPSADTSSDSGDYCRNTVYSDYPDTTTGCGYLYNWYAATAGSGTAGLASTSVADSICPRNWDLPTSDIYVSLNAAVDLAAGGGQEWQGTYSGALASAGFVSQSIYGYYWSSTASSTAANAYRLNFGSSSAAATSSNSKHTGFSIRCIL